MKNQHEVENWNTRIFIRSMYKRVHCHKNNGRFEVVYIDDFKKSHILGISVISRSDAWDNAAVPFYEQMRVKLEKYAI